jgi:hypothetical protein
MDGMNGSTEAEVGRQKEEEISFFVVVVVKWKLSISARPIKDVSVKTIYK